MRKRERVRNIVYAIICLVLAAGLITFLYWNKRQEAQQVEELKKIIAEQKEEQQNPSEDVKEDTEAGEETMPEDQTASQEEGVGEAVPEEQVAEQQISFQGISLRGDCFLDEDKKTDGGYGRMLYEIVSGEGMRPIRFVDYSMDQAGSMSQMRLAGVDENQIQSYLNAHLSGANEASLRLQEKKVRELTGEELARDDQELIPIICMGYYGGWNNDPEELAAQIELILATYSQQDCYIVAGLYPSVDVDKATYRSVMEAHFGEHYIQLDEKMHYSPGVSQGKREMADLLNGKLEELGYLTAE